MEICISKAVLKCCLREISELTNLSYQQLRDWKTSSEESPERGTDIGGEDCVASFDPFSLIGLYITE